MISQDDYTAYDDDAHADTISNDFVVLWSTSLNLELCGNSCRGLPSVDNASCDHANLFSKQGKVDCRSDLDANVVYLPIETWH